MIDALKPAFTLFQFKDDRMSENLGGAWASRNRKSFKETYFAYDSRKSARREQLPLCPPSSTGPASSIEPSGNKPAKEVFSEKN